MNETDHASIFRRLNAWRNEDGAYAVIQRESDTFVDILCGPAFTANSIDDIPTPSAGPSGIGHVVFAVPFRVAAECGYQCNDDGTPLAYLVAEEHYRVPLPHALAHLPRSRHELTRLSIAPPDEEYEAAVQRIIDDEIRSGAGSNFVIRRDLTGQFLLSPFSRSSIALATLRNLLLSNAQDYWRFAFHFPHQTLVGASPERHITSSNGRVGMTPMSGTYRYSDTTSAELGLRRFLLDRKETEELLMVVDEELKMMTSVCDSEVVASGPFLRFMTHLAHTEYHLSGRSNKNPLTILKSTLFAPTVVGSPLESAFSVVSRHEQGGRGYYSGVVGWLSRPAHGDPELDSAIIIRTAAINNDGSLRLSLGATIVRDSNPASEALETRAKGLGLLTAMLDTSTARNGPDSVPNELAQSLSSTLKARNGSLSTFWLSANTTTSESLPPASTLIVDMEDNWTYMLTYLLRSLGLHCTRVSWREVTETSADDYDLVLLGPGPGDPSSESDSRISLMRKLIQRRLESGGKLLAVCLGHQVLANLLGYPLVRLPFPNQGTQRTIRIADSLATLGFYNSFIALARPASHPHYEVWANQETGEIYGFRSPNVLSLQFHSESVFSADGVPLLRRLLSGLLT